MCHTGKNGLLPLSNGYSPRTDVQPKEHKLPRPVKGITLSPKFSGFTLREVSDMLNKRGVHDMIVFHSRPAKGATIWAQQIMLGKKFQFPPREGGDLAP